nr:FxDxF family PEP-CTERM protein [Massilia sp. CCM 8734]
MGQRRQQRRHGGGQFQDRCARSWGRPVHSAFRVARLCVQQRRHKRPGYLWRGGGHSGATAINNAGTIVGYAHNPSWRERAFIYQNGQMTDLGAFEGGSSVANDINDSGQIIGQSAHTWDTSVQSAFLYVDGVMTDLGWSAGKSSQAADINNLGQVIGYGADAKGLQHGFIYQNGQLLQLDAALDPLAGWSIRSTYSINDHGKILADACGLGVCGAVLLSPVPEPETYAMMLAGLGLLGVCARRRARRKAAA